MNKICFMLGLCSSLLMTAANAAELTFSVSAQRVKTLSLEQMSERLDPHEIRFFDPHYAKTKRYSGYKITDVLQLAYGKTWLDTAYSDVAFTALDGYKALGQMAMLKEPGGYLVFADLDRPDWEPIGRNKANPAPFYLVWTGKKQTTKAAFPWPWQLVAIDLIRFEDQYPKIYPQGETLGSAAYLGFRIFKDRCFRCHSINQQGGKIGPDLAAPKNILHYRSELMVKAFIKQPSRFRYSQMPDHLDLSDQQLDALIAYFRAKQ